ncbi:MAG: flagellin-like hook-associated protein FlgL [Flavobacterium sp.]|jgi:flagellin-like hook-associated protein FlgL
MPFSIAGPSGPALPSLDGINKATDSISSGQQVSYENNAAEAAITGRLDSAIGESTVSIRNAINQISSLQKADHSLGQASELIEKIQAFSAQSNNGSLSPEGRETINKQSLSLLDEVSTVIKEAEFNGTSLFSESGINIEDLKAKLDSIRGSNAPINQESLSEIQDELSLARADVGAQQNAIAGQVGQIENGNSIQSNRQSEISDTDFASEFAELIRQEIQFEASVKVFNHRISAEESLASLLS